MVTKLWNIFKGFFIVRFKTEQEREYILNKGPWFWGNAGLFMTPWFPGFDANTMVVSKMPIWVRLHNLPLHFCHHNVLISTGNTLGKFLKIDGDKLKRGIFTFTRICVEVDLGQGLPESITLNFNNTQWTQPLDYENTTFWCHGCLQTGHLHSACPKEKQIPKWNKKQQIKPKLWQYTAPLDEEADTAEEKKYKVEMEDQKVQNNTLKEEEAPNIPKQQQETQRTWMEISGIKRSHGLEGSDSDKDSPINTNETNYPL